MALEVEEVLSLWREAERLLDDLPDSAPERRIVTAEVVNLRRLYRSLTMLTQATPATLTASRETIESAHLTLAEAKRRIAGNGSTPG